MAKCCTGIKNRIIEMFDTIWGDILKKMSQYDSNQDTSFFSKKLANEIVDLGAFAKLIDKLMKEMFSDEGISLLPCDENFNKYVEDKYIGLVREIMNVMELLNSSKGQEIKEDYFDELKYRLGRVALTIRFDILITPDEAAIFGGDQESIFAKMSCINSQSGDYYQIRPLWQNSMRKILPDYDLRDTAIVMQGPVVLDNSFTFETLLRYRKIYPESQIVLSTWEDEMDDITRIKLESVGIKVLESEKPIDPGPSNIALQLMSSKNGVAYVRHNPKIKYVLKTRTDQRFFMPDFLLHMRNKTAFFPTKGSELRARISFLGGLNSLMTFPFRITDFMTFGNAEDIEKFYEAPFGDDRLIKTYAEYADYHYMRIVERIPFDNLAVVYSLNHSELKELADNQKLTRDPESYLVQSFYERVIYKDRIDEENDDIYRHYWNFLKKYAIIIDPEQLLFYWNKYRHKTLDINSNLSDGGLTESAWLDLCSYEYDFD